MKDIQWEDTFFTYLKKSLSAPAKCLSFKKKFKSWELEIQGILFLLNWE